MREIAARLVGIAIAAAIGAGIGLAPQAARAFEYFDGRLQVHGFFEEQIRGLDNNFSEQFDLAQWYNVLNVELEYDFAPDGWGPFDVLSGFMRLEARYDCVWTHGCGMFPSVNAYGDKATHLPDVKTTGRDSGYKGLSYIGSLSSGPFNPRSTLYRYTGVRPLPRVDRRQSVGGQPVDNPATPGNEAIYAKQVHVYRARPARIDQIPGFAGLFVVRGVDQQFEAKGVAAPLGPGAMPGNDDPAYFFFDHQYRCKFGVRDVPGGANGSGFQIIGPINPRCDPTQLAALRNKPNPFNSMDIDPILRFTPDGVDQYGADGIPNTPDDIPGASFTGSSELPARPASEIAFGFGGSKTKSKGVYYPSAGLRRWLKTKDFDNPGQDFSQEDLAWNHGDSQDEGELKEAYLDMEFFDSQLWIRAGKQSIVWGKTELFRTTDQFNPQDLALASLPSLEESRISLWSVRGVWSFYNVGPAEDVRLEVAFNFDDFQPADTGRCGEPYTALVACNKTFALWLHGVTGFTLAGEDRPDNPWHDIEGLEVGARLEFRLGRFSFQLSDFWGYEDLPYVDMIQSFSRNVDPVTGRPRRYDSGKRCLTGSEPACLPIQSNINPDGTAPDQIVVPANRTPFLNSYASNMQLFAMVCATSIGFNSVDPTACGQTVFNSQKDLLTQTVVIPRSQVKNPGVATVASGLGNALAGNPISGGVVQVLAGVTPPLVPLSMDGACDTGLATYDANGVKQPCVAGSGRTPVPFFSGGGALPTLNNTLTDEQEALLGCGPYWGSDCEADGIDLLNAEASVLMQSFVGFEGRYAVGFSDGGFKGWNEGNGLPQPGTIGFHQLGSALPGSRFQNGQRVQVAGARGPFLQDGVTPNPAYNVLQDGNPAGIPTPDMVNPNFAPWTGGQWQNEMAALSYNLQLLLVAFSSRRGGATTSEKDEFDPTAPYSKESGQCSFLQPQFCSAIKSFFDITGAQRNTIRAGGRGAFGRRDFVWHSGAEGVLRYTKRNVLGLSADFAEDFTKSNWGMEFTWIEGQRFTDNDQEDGITFSDTLNLTVSVDRPTFINFLNQNRTFFFNSQWFFQYLTNYQSSFPSEGPFNVLGTFTVQTGYFQDRLLPGVTLVYDVRSNSAAILPSISYRFTENFSATIGTNFFYGRFDNVDMPVNGLGTVGTEAGSNAYKEAVENGLSVVRERDEAYLRIRYTF